MIKITFAVIISAVVTALVTMVAVQRREIANLREENSVLKGEIRESQRASEQTEAPTSFQGQHTDLAQVQSGNHEFQLLRSEIGLLRKELDTMAHAGEVLKAKARQEEYKMFKNLYDELMSLPRADLRKAIPMKYRDEQLERYEADFAKTEEQYSRAYVDLGPQNLEVLRGAEIMRDIEQKIETRIDEVLSSLEILVTKKREALQKSDSP